MNWWTMGLATRADAHGRSCVDPTALETIRRTPFAVQLEMHMAQDALASMAAIRAEQAEHDPKSRK